MKKVILFILTMAFALSLNTSSATADGTYALVDANGNVTNIIVCGTACAGGEWAGQRAVPQVAPGPNNENRGGFWSGPGTTTYDFDSGTFTWNKPEETKQVTQTEPDGSISTSTVIINPGQTTQFKYSDTIGSNLFTRSGFITTYNDNTSSTLSVTNSSSSFSNSETIYFENRKTEQEINQAITNANLLLINNKIEILVNLLGGWIKP